MLSRIWKTTKNILTHPYLMIPVRLYLGYTFLISGWEKINHMEGFVTIVKGYNVLPPWIAEIFGRSLPFVEIIVAVYFVVGLLTRWTSVVTALMMFSFMIATVINLVRGTSPLNCGCFDLTEYKEGFGWHTFFRQVWYMVPITLAFFGRHTFLSIDSLLQRKKTPPPVVEDAKP
jgi:uncharacterized membrane protein YphA (DoxX/SURF4 family)